MDTHPAKPVTILRQASFNPQVCHYWLISGTIILTVTLIGIPFLLFWLPCGLFFTRRYLSRMECILTPKALKVKKGMLVRIEKTVPLEKITDMGMVQGPIMRRLGLHTLTVETAGQSGVGALVSLTGIEDAVAFREAVLEQRDAICEKSSEPSITATSNPLPQEHALLLQDIRDTLLRMETLLKQESKPSNAPHTAE